MTTIQIPTVDQYWERLEAGIPVFSAEEQRAAVTLCRELAKGQSVDAAQLSQAFDVSLAESWALLKRDSIKAFVDPDAHGRVLGFGGLAWQRCTIASRWMVAHCGLGARGGQAGARYLT